MKTESLTIYCHFKTDNEDEHIVNDYFERCIIRSRISTILKSFFVIMVVQAGFSFLNSIDAG